MPSKNPTRDLYRGRFAPSPTGDLHFGSLIAAVASYLEARRHNGQWLVRIEDIDPPREVEGSAERILAQLAAFGMTPDEEVLFQSTRMAAYEETIQTLLKQGDAYWCGCSRSDLPASGAYPGTCRQGLPAGREPRSVRFKTKNVSFTINDQVQGPLQARLQQPGDDFVIRRADGLPAYQLAVVVDDAFQSISHIVRGADLLDSTPRQVALQTRLGLPTPAYAHVPLATDDSGRKLSKRLDSDPVSLQSPARGLRAALEFLGHQPPASDNMKDTWDWALSHWDISRIPPTAVALEPGD